MKGWFQRALIAVALSATAGLSSVRATAQQPEASPPFSVGQVWKYRTRPGEEASRALIGRIDELPKLGSIVHVKLIGLKLKSAAAPEGFTSVIGHAPVAQTQFAASVSEPSSEPAALDGFEGGYPIWLKAFRAGKAGAFTLELSEVVRFIETSVNP